MRQLLGPDGVANSIRMTRSQFDGAIVVVEGNGSDSLFYKQVIDRRTAHLEPAHSKEILIEVVGRLNRESFAGLLGIADADRDRLLGKASRGANLFLTDSCDLESMLLLSPALDKVLLELGDDSKIQRFEEKQGCPIREFLFKAMRPLGALRLISERDDLALKFRDLRVERMMTEKLGLNLSKLLRTLRDRTPNPPGEQVWQTLPSRMDEIVQDSTIPSEQLCNGHDLVALLCHGLKRRWGTPKAQHISTEAMERLLRLAYETPDFSRTDLCASLERWEIDHPPFRVLRAVS